jgi:hypothetical protein
MRRLEFSELILVTISLVIGGGVKPVYIPAIWGIVVPPKIHLFLWLLAYNKLATVNNLNKKGLKKNTQCCLCGENESISHMFFECVVAKVTWEYVRELLGIKIGGDYISIASKWLHKEKFYCVNVISAVVLRSILANQECYDF